MGNLSILTKNDTEKNPHNIRQKKKKGYDPWTFTWKNLCKLILIQILYIMLQNCKFYEIYKSILSSNSSFLLLLLRHMYLNRRVTTCNVM